MKTTLLRFTARGAFAAVLCGLVAPAYAAKSLKVTMNLITVDGAGKSVGTITIKEGKEKAAAKWVNEKKMSCPVLTDPDGIVTRAFGPPPDFEPKSAREDLMTASVLLASKPKPTDADIDAAMTGNVCRCGTYLRIREAIHVAANGGKKA